MTSSQQRLALLCAVVYLLLSSFLVLHVVKVPMSVLITGGGYTSGSQAMEKAWK